LLPLLWLLAVKKKKLLLLLQHLLSHLLQLLLKPLLLLPPPLLLLLPQLLLLLAQWALPTTLPKKQLTQLKMPSRSNSSNALEKPPQGGFFTPVVFVRGSLQSFYRRIHAHPASGVATVMCVEVSSTWPRQLRTSSGRLFCWLRCAATTS
jgi:hypothetical protein